MFTVDLIVGYKNELLAKHLFDQYKQNEKNTYTSILYENTKLNKNLINMIINYSLSNISLNINDQKIDKLILCIDYFSEINTNKLNINNIYIYKYLLIVNELLPRSRKYNKYRIVQQNIKYLKENFNIDFNKRKTKEYKLFYHFTYDNKPININNLINYN